MGNSYSYFLGLVGLFQAVFLPGFCVTTRLQRWNQFQRAIYAIPLSIVINHFAVWILVVLNVYGSISAGSLIAVELVWIFLAVRTCPPDPISYPKLERSLDLLFLGTALLQVSKYVEAWGRSFGDVFQLYDAVASWNAWARAWQNNHIPRSAMYPAALPEMFSIPYALMGRIDIETFSKASVGILFLGALAALVELGFRSKESRRTAWASVSILSLQQARFFQSHWASGYADVPLAAMTIFAFCLASLEVPSAVWIYALTAGAASLVKQPGLLFTLLSPWLASGWTKWKDVKERWLPRAVIALLTIAPWYLYIIFRIYVAREDNNNVSNLSNLVHGGPAERWKFSIMLLQSYGGLGFLSFWSLLAVVGCIASRDARRWLVGFGLPYFLIWGTFFGYDIRNLSMSVFPFSFACAASISLLSTYLENRLGNHGERAGNFFRRFGESLWLLRVFLALAVLSLTIGLMKPIKHCLRDGSLLAWEHKQRLDLGDKPQVNEALAALEPCGRSHAGAISNYAWLSIIPEFHDWVKQESCVGINEKRKQGGPFYAVVDLDNCPADVRREIASLPSLYTDSRFVLVATDSKLPRACSYQSPL